ncbi:fatty acid--CoA ligase family protein [Helicobacter sp. 11S03491-1]|uniref:ANL family adenylate-forming protein n=1 Tax=Helicobacter sp. 11S03491-1 TaxID=1476196 RepID=UPI000BA7039B|nr:fatty acid--CoA ligase family protein [Helicobacter sp. 11S03491-1]PAF43785.1 hypothetical protein BKH45_00520 [Helicobacter sp. 11S03491-1]
MQGLLKNWHPFFQRFIANKNHIALIENNQKYTYDHLLEQAIDISKNLQIPDQSILALIGDYSFMGIATFLALIAKKCIIAPLLPNNFDHYLQSFGVEYLLQNGQITPYSKANTSHSSLSLLNILKANHSSGLIIFSSGSTGKPKAILHHLDAMLEVYKQKSFHPTNTAGVFLINHIAGIDVLFNQFAIGGTLSIPTSRTPQAICELIQTHKVEILPASPSFLQLLLLSQSQNYYNLGSLKLVVYGSEPMPHSVLKNLKTALPHVRFKQSFGTSETNAIKTKNSKTKEGFIQLDTSSTQYKIINNELWLKSKTQTLGYLNADNCVFQDGWFCTGDKVETMIENGEEYLKIIGRTQEIINVGGEKVFPQEIENIITQIEGIQDCLVYGEPHILTGQSISVALVVDTHKLNPNDKLGLKKLIRDYCKNYLPNYKIPTKVVIQEHLNMSERFKRLRNHKINYK